MPNRDLCPPAVAPAREASFFVLKFPSFEPSCAFVRCRRRALKSDFPPQVEAISGTFIANVHKKSAGANQTMITNDNGRSWRLLAIPERDINGRPNSGCVSPR